MTRTERTHILRADGLRALCGREAARFPFPAIALDGDDPTCGNCQRITAPPEPPEPGRCRHCGYLFARCNCAALTRSVPCGHCGSAAGEPCRDPGGAAASRTHEARYQKALRRQP